MTVFLFNSRLICLNVFILGQVNHYEYRNFVKVDWFVRKCEFKVKVTFGDGTSQKSSDSVHTDLIFICASFAKRVCTSDITTKLLW